MGEEKVVILGLSPHRVEFLPLLTPLLKGKDLIILEEPPHPAWKSYLQGDLGPEELAEALEAGFPTYSSKMARILKGFWLGGAKICQVEPYLEGLLEIQTLLEEGLSPEKIATLDQRFGIIYQMEHQTTATLLDFYASLGATFDTMVARVKAFAQADAQRIRLRDQLRAEAIFQIIKASAPKSIFVEAGYIHGRLSYFMAKKIKALGYRLICKNLLIEATQKLIRRWPQLPRAFLPAPGDGLTASYLFKRGQQQRDLLAARSLIYIKLITKEELLPSPEIPFPHLLDELYWKLFVSRLDYHHCRRIMEKIRLLGTEEARQRALKIASDLGIKINDLPPLFDNYHQGPGIIQARPLS